MNIIRYDTQAEDGMIKSFYIDIGNYRLLISLSESTWYTKGKKRLIPVWISKKGLFIYRLAIRFGTVPETNPIGVEMMNVSDYEYENEVQFDLVGEDGLLEHVMEISLQRAIDFFKDNYSGTYEIYWFDEKVHILKVVL